MPEEVIEGEEGLMISKRELADVIRRLSGALDRLEGFGVGEVDEDEFNDAVHEIYAVYFKLKRLLGDGDWEVVEE